MLVVVTFVIMTTVIMSMFMDMIGAIVRRLGLIRLWNVIDCAGRTQRFAFHALCALKKTARMGNKPPV